MIQSRLPELEELKVILHELEHVRHGDIKFNNYLQILNVEALQKYQAEY